MQVIADRPEASSAIRSDLGAIFVSLELSRSTWLITSLSPGGGGKMSKHNVLAGDIVALLARFSEFRQKAFARTGTSFPIIVIQESPSRQSRLAVHNRNRQNQAQVPIPFILNEARH
jgi:transposase